MKRVKLSKLLALACSLCMALVLFAGCGGDSSSASAPADGSGTRAASDAGGAGTGETVDKVVVGIEQDGGTLAPFDNVQFGNVAMLDNLYERLVFFNADGSHTLVLAESIEEIDELTYHIKIYDNIFDSEGNQIKAEDVVFSIDGYIEIGNNSGAAPAYESCSVVDDFTVEWKNKVPFGAGDMAKQMSNPRIVSRAAYEASEDGMATQPVSTSPYVMTNYIPGSTVVIEKRDDYWQTDESLLGPSGYANVDTIEFKFILDQSQMAMALQTGDIDFAGSLNVVDIASFEGDDSFKIVEKQGVKPWIMILNNSTGSACEDINLRKAILTGVDNDSIVATTTVDCDPLTSITSTTDADYVSAWASRDKWAYDATAAQAFVDDSDYDGAPLKLLAINNAISESCAMVIQSQLGELGIIVELDLVDNALYRTASVDGTAYDILVMENGGGAYAQQSWKNAYSYTHQKTPINDPTLQEKLDAAMLTGSETDLNAFQDYVDEMAYAKGLVLPIYKTASSNIFESIYYGTDNNFLINACTFAS